MPERTVGVMMGAAVGVPHHRSRLGRPNGLQVAFRVGGKLVAAAFAAEVKGRFPIVIKLATGGQINRHAHTGSRRDRNGLGGAVMLMLDMIGFADSSCVSGIGRFVYRITSQVIILRCRLSSPRNVASGLTTGNSAICRCR